MELHRTDHKLIDVTHGEVKLTLWKPSLNEDCIQDIASIAAAQEKDVGINPLR